MAQLRIDLAEIAQVYESEWLKSRLEEAKKQIFDKWQVADELEERERLHAELTALCNLKDLIYGEAKRLLKR